MFAWLLPIPRLSQFYATFQMKKQAIAALIDFVEK